VANTKYVDLLPNVLPELPGCSGPLAEQYIRTAVITLCRRTKVWKVDADPVSIVAGTATYDLDADIGTAIIEIQTMRLDGADLEPADDAYVLDIGDPTAYMQRTPETFTLLPSPTRDGVVTMTLSVAPSRASSSFPSWIAERYYDAIVAEAKATLMLMPGTTWYSPQQGTYYRSIFDQEAAVAKSDAMTSFVRATQRTTSHH
jgi:hypothetical protein